jgi:epoxyqueuosine reductase
LAGARLQEWIAAGRHGDMDWMPETAARRAAPPALWPGVRSIVMVGVNYGPEGDPLAALAKKQSGAISVYARNRDYHDLMKGRLKLLAAWLVQAARPASLDVKVFVDTAPVMEKPLAAAAGLGWQGKHTNLVSRRFGSWLFLGALFTDLALPPDAPEQDHCGRCRACLDVCPTKAFPAPYQLDARRCISYLTIEHKGHIAPEFRAAIGNRIYGCDDCLAVCPWNKFARAAREPGLLARAELVAPRLSELATLDDGAFRRLFAGSPIKRIGRDRFLRNVLIALGNSGDRGFVASAARHLADPSPLVRAMAVWALARLGGAEAFAAARAERLPGEADDAVRAEWQSAA